MHIVPGLRGKTAVAGGTFVVAARRGLAEVARRDLAVAARRGLAEALVEGELAPVTGYRSC